MLERFLPSVLLAARRYADQSQTPIEIVVVDDGSVDATVQWLVDHGFVEEAGAAEECSNSRDVAANAGDVRPAATDSTLAPSRDLCLRFIRNGGNLGFGPACNRGFQIARYPLVFLLNNDVDVEPNAIAPLVESFADDSVFAVHSRVFDLEGGHECGTGKVGGFSRGFIRVHRSYVSRRALADETTATPKASGPMHSMFASGGSAMFDRLKFLEMGAFDELLAPIYWEDVDISYRAWKRGFSVLYEPRSVVRHRVSSTMRNVDKRKVRALKQRNRLIYHWVNLHAAPLMMSHVLWILLLAITAPLSFRPGFLASLFAALRKLPRIRQRRLEEKLAARRSDREVFDIFKALEKRRDLIAYDDYEELAAAGLRKQP